MVQNHITRLPGADIIVTDGRVHIENLDIDDAVLADFLDSHAPDRWPAELAKVLAVGVRGITAMGAGATVKGVGEEVERLLAAVTADAETRVKEIIDAGRSTLAGSLDPDIRSSVTARALDEIESAHTDLLSRLDLDRADSHTARLVRELTGLLGPEGLLRDRLRETFDPGADESAMSRMLSAIDDRFRDMRDLIVGAEQRSTEAARGTAKGLDYEDEVIDALRAASAEIGGCTVEATGRVTGGLDANSMVGDAVVTLPDATRIAVEAKNTARVTLAGKDGILEELDRAMTNRDAGWAICTSKQDAYPREVGAFGIYGNRILLVDDGDGILLRVALRWIAACASATPPNGSEVDFDTVNGGLERLRGLAQRFTGSKRALAGVRTSIDQVRTELDGLRIDLLDLVDDLQISLRSGSTHSDAA
jgi:hypothetical protein